MEEIKVCPKCGKEVLTIAKKCKHCGFWFEEDIRNPRYRICPICCELIPKDSVVCPYCDECVEPPANPVAAPEVSPDTGTADVYDKLSEKESSSVSQRAPSGEKRAKTLLWDIVRIVVAVVIGVLVMELVYYGVRSNRFHSSVSSKPTPVVERTDEELSIAVAKRWNAAHQERNPQIIASLYAEQVYYYHENYTPKQISESKRDLFNKYPGFWQDITDIKCQVNYHDGTAKVIFLKEVVTKPGGSSKTYPSYLVMKKVDSHWRITVESDEVTDANLTKRRTK